MLTIKSESDHWEVCGERETGAFDGCAFEEYAVLYRLYIVPSGDDGDKSYVLVNTSGRPISADKTSRQLKRRLEAMADKVEFR